MILKSILETRVENINDFFHVREETGDKFHLHPRYLYLNIKEIKQINLINLK